MEYYEDIICEKDELRCMLCDIAILDNNAVIDAHLDTDNHKKLYINRLLLRNSMELQTTNTVSCLICNDHNINILTLNEHIRSETHKSTMDEINKIIMKDGSFIELPENEQYNKVTCLICNRDCSIQFSLLSIKNHVSSGIHRRARSIAIQPFHGICSVEGSSQDLWCKICKVYFDNYIESIFEHVDNYENHVTDLTKLLCLIEGQNISIEKYLVDPKEDKAKCNKCEIEVSCNLLNLRAHINGKGKGKHNGNV